VNNKVDPLSDMETINIELALADLDTLAKRRERAERASKVLGTNDQKAAEIVLSALDKIGPALENGKPVRSVELTDDEKAAVYDCHFITAKPQLYVCNVDEEGMKAAAAGKPNAHVEAAQKQAAAEGAAAVIICGKF
jgi:ribosome-binding ATPase YchF (GTP1/OBG family)